jgi:hypothetical protein
MTAPAITVEGYASTAAPSHAVPRTVGCFWFADD